MRAEVPIYYEGEIYRCIYLNAPTRDLSEDANDEINWTVMHMFKKGIREKKIKREDLKATIERRGKRGLGHYFGTYFKVEGECELGKLEAALLVLDRFEPELN